MTAPTRPARPVHIDPAVLAETSKTMGMPAREIVDVTDTDAGRIVTTHDGNRAIIVPADRPDAHGQHGVLIYSAPPALHGPRYAAPGPRAVTTGEPWTLADLDLAASREVVPAAVQTTAGPSHLPWIGNDPIRARAAWLHDADAAGVEPSMFTHRSREAARCREIVVASGWLADKAVAEL